MIGFPALLLSHQAPGWYWPQWSLDQIPLQDLQSSNFTSRTRLNISSPLQTLSEWVSFHKSTVHQVKLSGKDWPWTKLNTASWRLVNLLQGHSASFIWDVWNNHHSNPEGAWHGKKEAATNRSFRTLNYISICSQCSWQLPSNISGEKRHLEIVCHNIDPRPQRVMLQGLLLPWCYPKPSSTVLAA